MSATVFCLATAGVALAAGFALMEPDIEDRLTVATQNPAPRTVSIAAQDTAAERHGGSATKVDAKPTDRDDETVCRSIAVC